MDTKMLGTLLAFAALLATGYLLFAIVAPFAPAIGWATVIAILTFPLYERLRRRIPGRETVSAALMLIFVVLAVLVPAMTVAAILASELASVYHFLEEVVGSGKMEQLSLADLRSNPTLAPLLGKLTRLSDTFHFDLKENLVTTAQRLVTLALGSITTLLKNFLATLVQMLLMLFILFFLYRDGERLMAYLRSQVPISEQKRKAIDAAGQGIITGFVYGIGLTCLAQGTLAGLAYRFLGIPSAFLLATATFLAAPIPVVGTALIWAPCAGYLFLTGATAKGIGLVLWCVVVVGTADNIIRPYFMVSRVNLPIPLILIGAFGGLLAFGLLGFLFGPFLFAILYTLAVATEEETAASSGEPTGAAS
jgi:predicted PurR-regulated permease PerM